MTLTVGLLIRTGLHFCSQPILRRQLTSCITIRSLDTGIPTVFSVCSAWHAFQSSQENISASSRQFWRRTGLLPANSGSATDGPMYSFLRELFA
nr:uncharacterized protein CTRU02_13532 [Colletotrichum truncatum]KAF6783296.1 hypothetical protein CTRU02_13532 [Colletotrichum truncatum]